MTASIARMNLALHGVDDFAIARGDTLERPAFTDKDRLATFDMVLANPYPDGFNSPTPAALVTPCFDPY